MKNHTVELSHTILFRDIDIIFNNGLNPKKSNGVIICDYMYYFYDDENLLNQDFERLNLYLNKLNMKTIKK